MALIRFETNAPVPPDSTGIITRNLTLAVMRVAGEAEADVRVEVHGNRRMRMADDSDEPIAHVEIRNVDISKDRAGELTNAICPVIGEALGIRDSRVYIAVVSPRNSMWRVNGDFSRSAPAGDS